MLNGSAPVVVARWQGWGGMPVASPLGERKPLHATSLGKAFLAFSGERRTDLMQHVDFTRYTDRTLTTPADLDADLSISRIRGFTQDDNEIIEGIVRVAVPIRYPDGRLAACVSFNAPSHP